MGGSSQPLDKTKWRTLRKQAYYRDMMRRACCWICGEPIDYTLPAGQPWAYEPDHYYSRRDYPEMAYQIGNLMPAHAHCNRSRGAADPGKKRRNRRRDSALDTVCDGDIGTASRAWL